MPSAIPGRRGPGPAPAPWRREAAAGPQHAARQVADDAEGDEQHRQGERRRLGDAGRVEEEHERRLAGAEPVDGDRQQHDEEDDRDEGEVGRERRVDAEAEAEAPRLEHAQHLHADRGQRDGAEQAVMRGVALHGADDRRSRGVDAGPGQALHQGDQERRDPRAEHGRGHGGAAGRGDGEGGEDAATAGPAGRAPATGRTTAMASTPRTPRTRSMNTEATASAIGTPRRASAVARTASPPTLAGRNVPTKVLTKKTCRMAPRPTRGRLPSPGGRRERHQQPQPAPRHQRAIDDDEEDGGHERTGPRAGRVLPDERRARSSRG